MIVKDYNGYVLSGFGNPGYGSFSEHRFGDWLQDLTTTIGRVGKAAADIFGPNTPSTTGADSNASLKDAQLAAARAEAEAAKQAALLAQASNNKKQDNTMLYVAGGVGALLILGMMASKR